MSTCKFRKPGESLGTGQLEGAFSSLPDEIFLAKDLLVASRQPTFGVSH